MIVADVLADQSGVIARRQGTAVGLTPSDIARLLRRREWTVVHPGVYVVHAGPLTWQQRAWAGVLACWPAALSHQSALRAADGRGRRDAEERVIHVAVDRQRHLVEPDRMRLHRMAGFEDRVLCNLAPRGCGTTTLLDLATDARTDLEALGVLADACGARRTTARRLLDVLGRRDRIQRREWLSSVLDDIAGGTCSVLEHGYLVHVERAHGLPKGRRRSTACCRCGSATARSSTAPARPPTGWAASCAAAAGRGTRPRARGVAAARCAPLTPSSRVGPRPPSAYPGPGR